MSDQIVSVRRSASGHLYADKVNLHNQNDFPFLKIIDNEKTINNEKEP